MTRATSPSRVDRWSRYIRACALPLFVLASTAYVVMHSPLAPTVVRVVLPSATGRFVAPDAAWGFARVGDAAAPWVLLGAAISGAWLLSRRFDGAGYERPVVFGMLALGLVAVPSAALGLVASWTGTGLLRPPLGPLVAAVPAVAIVIAGLRRGRELGEPRRGTGRPPTLVLLVGGLAASLVAAFAAVGSFYPPTGYDALSYHAPLAAFLWTDGNLTAYLDRAPGVWALANPGTAELWYGLLLAGGGELLADMGQLPLALLGAAAVAAFTRRLGLRRGAAWLAAGAFLLVPLVLVQSTTQGNDIAGAAVLMATIALASAPVRHWSASRLACIGLGLGLAVTTKLALLPGAAGVILFVAVAVLARRARGTSGVQGARLALVALVFAAAVGPWWLRNATRYGNPIFPAAIPFVGLGVSHAEFSRVDSQFVPSAALWPLYPLFERHGDRSGVGALFLVCMAAGFVAVVRRARRQPLLLYAAVAGVTVPAWWVLTNHEPRFLLPLAGLAMASLPWGLAAVPRARRRIAGALVVAAAASSAAVTVHDALLPLAGETFSRAAFYDSLWGVDPVVASLPESAGILLQTGYARRTYASYYPLLGPSRSRTVIPVDTGVTGSEVAALMREADLQHAYVAASDRADAAARSVYAPDLFDLVHASPLQSGSERATRYLYRLRSRDATPTVARRGAVAGAVR